MIAAPLTLCASVALAQDPASLAQQRYLRALRLYDARQFTEALAELRGSYQLRASPNSRLLMARCLRELGRIPEAVTEFETTLHEASEHASTDVRYADTERAARTELAELEPRVGRLRLTIANAPPSIRVRINALELPNSALELPIPVTPGAVSVTILAEGLEPLSASVNALAGMTHTVTLTFAADATTRQLAARQSTARSAQVPAVMPPTPQGPWLLHGPGPLRFAVWASWGIGAAGFLTAAALGVAAQSAFADLERACGGRPCPPSQLPAIDAGRALQLGTNVSLAVGLGGSIVGTTLYLVGASRAGPPSTARPTTSPRFAWIPSPLGLTFVGEL